MAEMKQDQFGRYIPSNDKRVFSNTYNPMVRIGNRMFFYDNKGFIRGTYPDLDSLGFEKKGSYFERPANDMEIESAYVVTEKHAIYKGISAEAFSFDDEGKHLYIWIYDEHDGKASGIKPEFDYGDRLMYQTPMYRGAVPVEDITEIYEIRKPFKDFKFIGPEIVYHNKNGEWIQWHLPGTPLMEGELF